MLTYLKQTILSSLVKKYVMAITGFVLASFLLVHMLGNLQMLEGGPHAINAYANFLQTLPWEILWGFRLTLFVCIVLHFLTGFLLVLENWRARPCGYSVRKFIVTDIFARSMIYTGSIIIVFVVIHILHYTVLALNPEFKHLDWLCESGMYEGKTLHDVYAMMVLGFNNIWVSVAYIVAMLMIGFHLTHGVTSMFQSIGFRNEKWRYRLNFIAIVYAVIVFGGFSINPIVVLSSKFGCSLCNGLVPVDAIVKDYEAQKGKEKIFIDYEKIFSNCKCSSK